MKFSLNLKGLMVGAFAAAAAVSASAQGDAGYPSSRPVRLVVSQQAGGSTDSIARLWAEHVGKQLNANIVVENKPGAGGAIAAQYVLGQPADGHTLFLAGVSQMVLNKFVYKPLAYSPEKDFVGVTTLTTVPFVLVANPAAKFRNYKEFAAAAKSAPGSLSFASSGNGNSTHLVVEMLMKQTGVKMVHVPFRGEPDGVMATVSGTTQLMAPVFSTALPQIKQGKLVPLVLVGEKRSPELPDVPTASEVGLSGLDNIGWSGIAARTGTSPQVIEKLSAASQVFLKDPAVVQKLQSMQVLPMPGGSGELMRLTVRDTAKWQQAIGDLDLNVKQ